MSLQTNPHTHDSHVSIGSMPNLWRTPKTRRMIAMTKSQDDVILDLLTAAILILAYDMAEQQNPGKKVPNINHYIEQALMSVIQHRALVKKLTRM